MSHLANDIVSYFFLLVGGDHKRRTALHHEQVLIQVTSYFCYSRSTMTKEVCRKHPYVTMNLSHNWKV